MSIPKNCLLITFASLSQALQMERCCHMAGIEGSLIPTPRQISSSCSTSWCSAPQQSQALLNLMARENIRPQGIHPWAFYT